MTDKERYIQFAAQTPELPLFLQPWWLEAVCVGKEWDVFIAQDEKANIIGVMPYLLRKRLGFRYIIMPQQTQLGGIWVCPKVADSPQRTSEVCLYMKERLDQLGIAYYYQQYIPGSVCVDSMREMGFDIRERVTYRVDDWNDLDALVASFSKNKRRQLQKASNLHAERTMSVEEFYLFHTRCLAARQRKCRYSRAFLLELERQARQREQCEILSIHNANGQVLAAAFLVWNQSYMYYLIPTYDPAFGDSGAGALLVLEAIKSAREKKVQFDFEGSMEKGTAEHYRQFGSIPVTYYSVEKTYKPLFRIALWIQKLREWQYR